MWSIDRIEGDVALCENTETEEQRAIPLSELPPDIHEGDLLQETAGSWERLPRETAERRRELSRRLFELFGDR